MIPVDPGPNFGILLVLGLSSSDPFRFSLDSLLLVVPALALRVPQVQRLGTTVIPQTLAYLDSGFVFVGSMCGDSQLVQLASGEERQRRMREGLPLVEVGCGVTRASSVLRRASRTSSVHLQPQSLIFFNLLHSRRPSSRTPTWVPSPTWSSWTARIVPPTSSPESPLSSPHRNSNCSTRRRTPAEPPVGPSHLG